MTVYWLLFLSASAASFLHLSKYTKDLQITNYAFLFFWIVFVAGFKYASIDYFGYEELFYTTSFSDFSFPFYEGSRGTTAKEFVWATFSSVFKYLGFTFPFWIFFVALVSVSIKFCFFKKYTPYFLLAIAIYITQGFIKDMGQLRNGLAGAILLFAVMPIIKRQMLKFILVVIFAFGVQAYAIVALPLYWFYPYFKKFKFKLVLVLVGFSVLSYLGGISELILSKLDANILVPDRVMHKVEGYANNEGPHASIVSVTGISYVLISIFLISWKERIHVKDPVLTVFSMFHFYGVSLFLLFTGINTLNNRSLDLFSMPSLPFLLITPLLLCKGYTKILFMLIVIIFCGLRLYANPGGLNPYMTVF